MAKKKIKKQAVSKSSKTIKKSYTRIPVVYFLIFLLILAGIFVFGIFTMPRVSKTDSIKFDHKASLKQIKKLDKILMSPYPTKPVTETPTTVPLTGYCLRVPVLMYHHIQPEAQAKEKGQTALTVDAGFFDIQMKYLAENGYTTLFANELTSALRNHTVLPAKSIVVTLDDGYADNYIYALPILEKYNLKANIMLASGLMGNGDMLSWDQVKALKASGHIYFTNHTWSHYAVNRGSQAKIESEIDVAQKQIQDITGQPVTEFTYPYGAFNDNAIQTLARKGYTGAFTEIPGFYQCDSFLMTLHRTRIGNASLSYYGI